MDASNIVNAKHSQAGNLPKDDGKYQWKVYDNDTYVSIVTAALLVIDQRIIQAEPVKSACNAYFETMSKARNTWPGHTIKFTYVWTQSIIAICYWPNGGSGDFGVTSGNFISLSQAMLAKGNTAQIAGTLVHEMAHWAGAGASPSTEAEDALKSCGFSDVYDSRARG